MKKTEQKSLSDIVEEKLKKNVTIKYISGSDSVDIKNIDDLKNLVHKKSSNYTSINTYGNKH